MQISEMRARRMSAHTPRLQRKKARVTFHAPDLERRAVLWHTLVELRKQ